MQSRILLLVILVQIALPVALASAQPPQDEQWGSSMIDRISSRRQYAPTTGSNTVETADPVGSYSNRGLSLEKPQPTEGTSDAADRLALSHQQSFLNRASENEKPGFSLSEQLNKIALNLVIVLFLATVAMLGIRHFQKAKFQQTRQSAGAESKLKVLDIMQVDRETSLTLVAIQGTRVLLAKDGGGTKSLVVIPNDFRSSLDEEVLEPVQKPRETAQSPEPEPLGDIDQRLLKMFVGRPKKAA